MGTLLSAAMVRKIFTLVLVVPRTGRKETRPRHGNGRTAGAPESGTCPDHPDDLAGA